MVTVSKPKGRSSALPRPIPKSALAAIERDRWIGYPIGDAGLFRLNELYVSGGVETGVFGRFGNRRRI
jgi:hypothetical protein